MTDLNALVAGAIDASVTDGSIVGDYSASTSMMADYVLTALGLGGYLCRGYDELRGKNDHPA